VCFTKVSSLMNQEANGKTGSTLHDAKSAFESGRLDLATLHFQEVLKHEPDNAEALYFLAVISYQEGNTSHAFSLATEAIASHPTSADCHNLLGLVLLARGDNNEARAALRKALTLEPDFVDAANNIGAAYEADGDFNQAEAAYRHALSLTPDFAQAHSNLGRILLRLGRPGDAEVAFQRALAANEGVSEIGNNLAVAQQRQGKVTEAQSTLEEALGVQPENPSLLRFLGALKYGRGDLAGAEAALRKALTLQPSLIAAHDNLAGVFLDQGLIGEAEQCFKQELNLDPNSGRAHSNLLMCQNYYETDPEILYQAHLGWSKRQQASSTMSKPYQNIGMEKNQLRIGYVSGDLRTHSVAYFLEPLLRHHDRKRFEVICYANLENPDATTARLRELSDRWRWVAGLTDDQLAAKIRGDDVDILVDLSGHTAGNRLPAFQRRPAPIQATWLGYPNTTGLESIDYRVTDALADPPGEERFAVEKLVRLDVGFLCYLPPETAPPIQSGPAEANGYVTFGSFNNLRKMTPSVIETWSEILHRAPTARLLLKARPLADPATAARVTGAFGEFGVASDRITLRGPVTSSSDHLDMYADLDIALDPFPYNGTTTTCEALWMGVPVVTVTGNRHAGRVGTSLLSQVGLESCIATNMDDYVATALRLAEDKDTRYQLRKTLRQRMLESPLCDAADFAHRMEAAFEEMWRRK
jgi:protein O-GlcNAc transferase